MPKDPKDEQNKQEPPKHSNVASAEEIKKHEPIIQDRIAGMTVGELAKKHQYSRSQIRNILDANLDRIQQERQAYLDDRQEKINAALEKDVQTLADLIGESSETLLEVVRQVRAKVNNKQEPLSTGKLIEACDVIIKAFDKVHSVALNQQKEADKG